MNDDRTEAPRAASRRGCALDLDCSLTVNAVLAHFPSTWRVFNRFGVDTCCSAVLTVEDAAMANGVDRVALCGALREALFV